jgi:hypothetical protein
MAIGKKAGDLKTLKRELKASSGDKWFWRVPANDEVKVRFLAEPVNIVKFAQHFDNTRPKGKQAFPCDDGACEGCDEGLEKRYAWAAPVLDVDEDRVRVLQLPKTVMDILYVRYEKYDTIMDREMLIMRQGSTKDDTKYMIDTLDRRRINLKKYAAHMPDIEAMLQSQLDEAMRDDDDDDDDRPRGKSKFEKIREHDAKKKGVRKPSKQADPWEGIDDDDDDDDEADAISPPRRGVKRSTGAARVSTPVAAKRGLKKSTPPPVEQKRGLPKKGVKKPGLRRK